MKLAVHLVIFSLREEALQVLLALSSDSSNYWGLPGEDLLEYESLEDAASRTLRIRLNHPETYLEQLYTYGHPDRVSSSRVVRVVYFALVPAEAHLLPDFVALEQWFPIGRLPVLVSDHADILSYALRRLRYKLEYSAVGFELLPDEFTLSEIQHTYEIILGEDLDKRNFRRRLLKSGIIEETRRQRTGEGRPARLYRYRADAVAEIKARRLFP